MEDEYMSDSDTSSEDSGSDWEDSLTASNKKAKGNRPPTKKIKLAGNVSRGRKIPNLRALLDLPLDVVFQILGLLAPVDLLSLTRSSKMLRQMLMSRNAISIWKSSFRNQDPVVPRSPKGMSEPAWANLLFGGSKCQTCDAPGIHKVSFSLRRRVCTSCLKSNLVRSAKFSGTFPDYDPLIMELILYTNVGGWSHGQASRSKFFWKSDIEEMAPRLAEYQKDAYLHKPGAVRALEDFKKARKEFVDKAIVHARRCKLWSDEVATMRSELNDERVVARREAIHQKFRELGYANSDIVGVCFQPLTTPLTDRIWKRIRPIHEPEVAQRKATRLAAAREALIRSRQPAFSNCYMNYLRRTFADKPVKEYLSFPRASDVFEFEEVLRFLCREKYSDRALEDSDRAEVVAKLDVLIQGWTNERKKALAAMLPGIQVTASSSDDVPDVRLRLATSVFQCALSVPCITAREQKDVHSILIGWDEVAAHGCTKHTQYGTRTEPTETIVKYSERGSLAAHSLIQLFRLDPRTTFPADLDSLDVKLTCPRCPLGHYKGINGRHAMSWREAISHFASERTVTTHPTPQWEVLSPAARDDVKRRLGVDPAVKQRVWSCNLCPIHIGDLQTRENVVVHVKATHLVAQPREGLDFFLDPREVRDKDAPYAFHPIGPQASIVTSLMDKADCRCLVCPGNSARRFKIVGVKDHLKAKHGVGVTESLPGVHFVQT